MQRTIDWMKQAQMDLDEARIDIELGLYEWAYLTAKQSAEEAIKAVFQKLGKDVRGHSILKMLEEIAENLNVPDEIFECARLLDRYYIEPRYPNSFPNESSYEFFDSKIEIANQAYDSAEKIVGWARSFIGEL